MRRYEIASALGAPAAKLDIAKDICSKYNRNMERSSLAKTIAAGVARLRGRREDSHVSPGNHVVHSRIIGIDFDNSGVSPRNHVVNARLIDFPTEQLSGKPQ